MIELKMDVLIDRPRPEVFDFLSDPANLPRWNSVIQSAQWTTREAPGVGSTYRVRAKFLGLTNGPLTAFGRLFVRMGEKTDGQNLATAKQILEAR
jgi:hypothetical protein